MLLTKDTQLMAHALAAAWAREAYVQPFPPPRMVLVGGMRAGLYRLERAVRPATRGLAAHFFHTRSLDPSLLPVLNLVIALRIGGAHLLKSGARPTVPTARGSGRPRAGSC